jgi:hypothetical protein
VSPAIAIASKGVSCKDASSEYAQAIAGCDQTTKYQCGVPGGFNVDAVDWNPTLGDTGNGAQCLINSSGPGPGNAGQDSLAPGTTYLYAYPFQIDAGTNNPLSSLLAPNSQITSSNSIVALPIYDYATSVGSDAITPVTIVGFLQVFINYVNADGTLDVVVMNVVGCGTGTSTSGGTVLTGTSPVPIRLITPPSS